jgi:hypothetical protein
MAMSVFSATRQRPNHENPDCPELKRKAPNTQVSNEDVTGTVNFGRCSGGMMYCSTAMVKSGAKFLKTVTKVRLRYSYPNNEEFSIAAYTTGTTHQRSTCCLLALNTSRCEVTMKQATATTIWMEVTVDGARVNEMHALFNVCIDTEVSEKLKPAKTT